MRFLSQFAAGKSSGTGDGLLIRCRAGSCSQPDEIHEVRNSDEVRNALRCLPVFQTTCRTTIFFRSFENNAYICGNDIVYEDLPIFNHYPSCFVVSGGARTEQPRDRGARQPGGRLGQRRRARPRPAQGRAPQAHVLLRRGSRGTCLPAQAGRGGYRGAGRAGGLPLSGGPFGRSYVAVHAAHPAASRGSRQSSTFHVVAEQGRSFAGCRRART